MIWIPFIVGVAALGVGWVTGWLAGSQCRLDDNSSYLLMPMEGTLQDDYLF